MMKKAVRFAGLSLILSAALGFTAPAEGVYTPGTYTATASGMGELSVSVTVDDSSIVDIAIDGANETPEIGGAALETLAEQVKESQGAGIEGVSGASITSDAVRVAVEKALAEASGSSSSEKAAVADGTYQAKAPSFGVMKEMELAVTFENNEITGIETICAGSATQADEDEYSPQYATVEEYLYPRIIEAQSLAVDSISGATVSSNAAKSIISKIIDENGGKASEWYADIPKSEEVVELDGYDVIVVGLGTSGVASYLSAALEGATVFGMETAAKIGGNGTNTAGPLGVNPARQVELNGGELFVDPDELFDAWMEYTEGDAKEWAIDMMMESSGDAVDYLIDNGFVFASWNDSWIDG